MNLLPRDEGSSGWFRSKADLFFRFWNPGILQPNKKHINQEEDGRKMDIEKMMKMVDWKL